MSGAGFIGLGWMGEPMASNLIKAGHEVTVFDLRPEPMDKLAELGAKKAAGVRDVAGCDPIFIIVQTGDQVSRVLEELACGVPEGERRTVAAMSTITPKLIRELAAKYGPQGLDLLDAPVSGAPIVAQMGTLSIMVGGETEHLQTVRPYLEAMGQTIVHLGPLGAGLSMKLVNNLVGLANGYILPEALKLGVAGGLDMAAMVKVIKASSGSNWLVENWPMYLGLMDLLAGTQSQMDNFDAIAVKDLESVVAWTEELGLESPVSRAVLSIVEQGSVMIPEILEKMKAAQVE